MHGSETDQVAIVGLYGNIFLTLATAWPSLGTKSAIHYS